MRNPADCHHERLEGDVSGSRFDDHRTTRGLCPDCGQYTIATDFADGRSESRAMTDDERIAWAKAACQDIECWECGTEFGETHSDEAGEVCQRAPGSDRCLQCLRREDDLAYFGALYRAGMLDPEPRDDDEEYRAEMIDAGRGHLLRELP